MCVQPYGNSDGSDKGDYHGKWEAAINNKNAKYMYPLSKSRCLSSCVSHPNSPWMSCCAIYQPFLWNSIWYKRYNLTLKISMDACKQTWRKNTQPVYSHIQKCHKERPPLEAWTTQLSAVRPASRRRRREWVIIPVNLICPSTPPFPLSLPPLATWHTLWLICQCAGIIGAGHAWCVRDRMSR